MEGFMRSSSYFKIIYLILILLLGSCVSSGGFGGLAAGLSFDKTYIEGKWCRRSDTNEYILCKDLTSEEKKNKFEKERKKELEKWCQRSDTNEYVLCGDLPSEWKNENFELYKWCRRSDSNEIVFCQWCVLSNKYTRFQFGFYKEREIILCEGLKNGKCESTVKIKGRETPYFKNIDFCEGQKNGEEEQVKEVAPEKIEEEPDAVPIAEDCDPGMESCP
jgi:hypothetical protein